MLADDLREAGFLTLVFVVDYLAVDAGVAHHIFINHKVIAGGISMLVAGYVIEGLIP